MIKCGFCDHEIDHPENQPNIHHFYISDDYAHAECFSKRITDLDVPEPPMG